MASEVPYDQFLFGGKEALDGIDPAQKQATYTPTIEERKAIKLAEKLLDRAKKYRKNYDNKWMKYYKFFRGRQWEEQRPSYRHSEVINMVFQNIQATVPILTDSRPRLEFVPKNPTQNEFAEILNHVCVNDWEEGNWLYQLIECIYDSHIYGTGLGTVDYDPKANFGLGGICFESADPFYCYPDPACRDLNDKRMRYFVYAEPVDVEILKAEYPDKAKWLKSDVIDLDHGSKTDLDNIKYRSPVDQFAMIDPSQGGGLDQSGREQVLKITVYLKSDETEEVKIEGPDQLPDDGGSQLITPINEQPSDMAVTPNPDVSPVTVEPMQGGENPIAPLYQAKVKEEKYVTKKKYPNGRKICIASGVLLYDGPIPFDDGRAPFAKLVNYPLPREFWGQSEIEPLESPQKVFNKLVSFALDVITLMGNPVWVIDSTSGIDTDNVVNRPGLILEPDTPNARVERIPGVALSGDVLAMIDRFKQWFDGIQGSSDLSKGIEPTQVTAASAIEALQETAQTRIRQKTRLLDAFLQNIGQMYLSRVFQFYDAPRIIKATNNENADQYFKFHVETQKDDQGNDLLNDDGSPKRVAKVRRYNKDETTNQYFEDIEEKNYEIEGEFSVRVSTGSTLPFAKAQKVDESVKLFQLGVIDDLELLKNLNYPNYEAVVSRMQQKRQEMAQAQAQQAQMAG